ncbi:MAG: hypothetical protein ACI9R3_006554, partial [Verrucomicrobiales bacterium]
MVVFDHNDQSFDQDLHLLLMKLLMSQTFADVRRCHETRQITEYGYTSENADVLLGSNPSPRIFLIVKQL